MVVTVLSACGKGKDNNGNTGKDGRISICMYMWDRSMFKEFSPWLEQKFPDIDFTFIQSYNTMEYTRICLLAERTYPTLLPVVSSPLMMRHLWLTI